jgi:hypothetical protein
MLETCIVYAKNELEFGHLVWLEGVCLVYLVFMWSHPPFLTVCAERCRCNGQLPDFPSCTPFQFMHTSKTLSDNEE